MLALLRTSVVATLGGWGVAVLLIVISERWLAPAPAPGSCPPTVQEDPSPAPTSQATRDTDPDDVLVPGAALDPGLPSQTAHRLAVAEPDGVNLRAEPTTASKILAVVPKGTLVEERPNDATMGAASPDWRRVVWNGQAGWVAASLLQAASPP